MKVTKGIFGFLSIGISAYLIYKNFDKIKQIFNSMNNLMKKEYNELEDIL